MELNQLEYFKAMAHINHFTQAAKAISVSQPALSRSIAKLEQELGVKLFDRSDKKITLTAYGQHFLIHIERALQEIATAKQEIAEQSGADSGIINLSFIHSLGGYLLPMLLSEFKALHPNIQFNLNQNNSAVLAEQLANGEADLCLCSAMMSTERIGWIYLCSEELYIVVPHNHPLANRQSIELKDISAEPFITLKPTYSLRILADQLFELSGSTPEIIFEGDDIITVASLVAAKLGVALIPKVPGMEHLGLKFLPISSPACKRAVGIAWNTSQILSPAALLFQQFVINRFADAKSPSQLNRSAAPTEKVC